MRVAGLLLLALVGCTAAPGQWPAPSGAYEAIVVLGHRPAIGGDGHIERELEQRMAQGLDLWREGFARRLLLVGGAPEDRVMLRYAIAHSVPADAVLQDGRSRDTIDNARFARERLCAGRAHCGPRVLLVTSDYHLARAAELFRCAGFDVDGAPAVLQATRAQRRQQRRHEVLTRFAYLFVDECGQAAR